MTRKNLRNLAIFVLAATLFTPMAWSGKKKKANGEAAEGSEAAVIRNLDIFNSLYKVGADTLTGVFHSFTGNEAELEEIKKLKNFNFSQKMFAFSVRL